MKRRRNGEGSYYQNSHGLYVYSCRYTDPLTGKSIRKSITASSQKKLDEKVTAWKDKQKAGQMPSDKMTVDEWGQKFLADVKPSLKDKTYKGYKGIFNQHITPALGKIRLNALTAAHIQKMINDLHEKGLSPATVATVRRILSISLNKAVAYRLIPVNPVNITKAPRQEKKLPIVLSKEQIVTLLVAADKCEFLPPTTDESQLYLRRCYFYALAIAIDSGARYGELFALRWRDLVEGKIYINRALEGNKIGSPKTTTSYRAVTLSKGALKLLEEWKAYQEAYCTKWGFWEFSDSSLIFTSSWGTLVYPQNLAKRWWKPLLKATKMPQGIHWHSLRATMATQLLQAGIPIKAVTERLGHTNVSVTLMRYAGLIHGIEEQSATVMGSIWANAPLITKPE
ncbi:MAG: site-specific integrase [Acidaminococcaceae bacterium]|nr:site-specific integrase [Acidaminococcaceae bacterium]